jgi:transcriptional regulator with XRE-family HTH domain
MMCFKKGPTDDGEIRRSLALHVRRMRQWYERRPLTQDELAKLSGLSPRQLRWYEGTTELPSAVRALLRIAVALKVPMQSLLAPSVVGKEIEQVEKRRTEMGLGTLPYEDSQPDNFQNGSREP